MNIFKLAFTIGVLAYGAGIVSIRAQDNPAQAAARAALEQMFHPAATNPAQPPMLSDPQPAATIKEPAEAASATETNAQKEATLAGEKHTAAEKAAKTVAAANPAVNPPGMKPIIAPPLPISAAKQSQLDTLLDLYKSDKITPADYQKQRAAILAAP
jgi:hypothetical protein